jgi:hypothetical protein
MWKLMSEFGLKPCSRTRLVMQVPTRPRPRTRGSAVKMSMNGLRACGLRVALISRYMLDPRLHIVSADANVRVEALIRQGKRHCGSTAA